MKLIDQISNAVLRDDDKIDDKTLDYYHENPDELDLIINKEHFNSLFLGIFFVLGIGVTLSSRIIQYFYKEQIGVFIDTVILDLFSELGIAIFGGAVVAYIIEFLNKRQYQSNLKFRNQVKAKLKERENSERSDKS